MARSNRKIVPESRQMINQMKYEIAAEFGLPVAMGSGLAGSTDTEFAGELGAYGSGSGAEWKYMTSRENGSVGGEITKRLVAEAQKQLLL